MTTSTVISSTSILIAPSLEAEDDFAMEHSIVVTRYSDAVWIVQNGQSITVPHYALREFMAAVKKMGAEQ